MEIVEGDVTNEEMTGQICDIATITKMNQNSLKNQIKTHICVFFVAIFTQLMSVVFSYSIACVPPEATEKSVGTVNSRWFVETAKLTLLTSVWKLN